MGRKLILVTSDDRVETPLFCSESHKEVADYLGCTVNALNSKICKDRRKDGDGRRTRSGRKVFVVELTENEFKEVTDAKA